jgi:hypothetical protein
MPGSRQAGHAINEYQKSEKIGMTGMNDSQIAAIGLSIQPQTNQQLVNIKM